MNQQPPTDWLSAAAMLLAGLVLGAMFIYAFTKKKPPASPDLERRDLEAKRDALVARLREEGDDPEERGRLEVEAAEVLRRLDGLGPAPAVAAPAAVASAAAPAPAPAGNPAMRGFLWGAGSVAALALLGWFVAQSTQQRGEKDGLTGGGPPGAASATSTAGAPDAELAQLEAAVRAQPDNANLRIDLARAYMDRENMMGVFEQTQAVLEKSPNHAHALTYQALVRMAMGQRDQATQMLQAATQSDPTLLDAWVSLAWIQMQSGQRAEAEQSMASAIRAHPEEEARLRDVLAQMKARVDGAAAAPAPAPASGAPAPGPAAPGPAAASGPTFRVTIDVDPAIRINPSAVLFVIARPAGVTAGPPTAVKRVPASGFPLQLELSAADSMMGQPLPDRIRIDARVDADGVATTRDPGEPAASQDGVAAGSTTTLTLR